MSTWKEIGDMVSDVAPTIASGLVSIVPGGGLFGPVAALAVRALTDALGMGADKSPDEVAAVLSSGDPDVLLKIKQAEYDYKLKLKQADVDIEKVHQADRVSARLREVAVKDNTPKILAWIVTFGFFSLIGIMAFHDLPVANKEILYVLIGALGVSFSGVIAYYFGSTRGSEMKNTSIANLTNEVVAAKK